MAVREQIAKDLAAAGLLEKVEDYDNKVGYSERNADTAVEPRLCMQWYLSMQHFADLALPPVMEKHLQKLVDQHSRLVHQPTIVVGTSYSGLLYQ